MQNIGKACPHLSASLGQLAPAFFSPSSHGPASSSSLISMTWRNPAPKTKKQGPPQQNPNQLHWRKGLSIFPCSLETGLANSFLVRITLTKSYPSLFCDMFSFLDSTAMPHPKSSAFPSHPLPIHSGRPQRKQVGAAERATQRPNVSWQNLRGTAHAQLAVSS